MIKMFSFNIDENLLSEFKEVCDKYQVTYTKLLTLAIKFIIKKNSETDNLIFYLIEYLNE